MWSTVPQAPNSNIKLLSSNWKFWLVNFCLHGNACCRKSTSNYVTIYNQQSTIYVKLEKPMNSRSFNFEMRWAISHDFMGVLGNKNMFKQIFLGDAGLVSKSFIKSSSRNISIPVSPMHLEAKVPRMFCGSWLRQPYL